MVRRASSFRSQRWARMLDAATRFICAIPTARFHFRSRSLVPAHIWWLISPFIRVCCVNSPWVRHFFMFHLCRKLNVNPAALPLSFFFRCCCLPKEIWLFFLAASLSSFQVLFSIARILLLSDVELRRNGEPKNQVDWLSWAGTPPTLRCLIKNKKKKTKTKRKRKLCRNVCQRILLVRCPVAKVKAKTVIENMTFEPLLSCHTRSRAHTHA